MEFLNAGLLAGAAMAAVPIVLHLIMRQNPRKLEFPAMQFLRRRQQANRRRLLFRHWLLLLARVALICFLALALARPSLKSTGGVGSQEEPVAVTLVFDTSPRMAYRHQNETRIETATRLASTLIPTFPTKSQIAVLDSRTNTAVFQVDGTAAARRLDRLDSTFAPRPLADVIEEAVRLLDTSTLKRRELYIFTDLCRGSWGTGPSAATRQLIGRLENLGIYIVDVGVPDPQNTQLTEVALSAEVLSRTTPLRLQTMVAAQGAGGPRVVELLLADEQGVMQKRGQQEVTLDKDTNAPIEFNVGGLQAGSQQGILRISGADALDADNQRFFTVEVRPPWKVLIAAGSPAQENAFLFSEAIAPERFRLSGLSRFETTVVNWQELADQKLEEFAAVCLLDPPALGLPVWQKLSSYALAGGGILVTLGKAAEPAESFNQSGARELLPADLLLQAREEQYLAPVGYQRSFLQKFQPIADQVPWDAFSVYRYWQLGELTEDASVAVPFANHQPALVERTLGSGRVLVLTTPLTALDQRNPWNVLLAGTDAWPALMLLNEAVLYLAGSEDSQLNGVAGSSIVLRFEGAERVSSYLLTDPLGEETRRAADASQSALFVQSTEIPGNYKIRAGGDDHPIRRGFSVNIPAQATELTRLPEAELAQSMEGIEHKVAHTMADLEQHVARGRVGRELFPYLMLLVTVILGAEHFLGNRFYKDTDGPVEQGPPEPAGSDSNTGGPAHSQAAAQGKA